MSASNPPTSAPCRVLVFNAGSSTLKWSLLDETGHSVDGATDAWSPSEKEATARVEAVLGRTRPVDAIGHRLVHGGTDLRGPVRIDPSVRVQLGRLVSLAPRHMGPELACIDVCTRLVPSVPQVAAFDTAFHATLPEAATRIALPAAWVVALGLRRYGFHGLSVAWSVDRVRALLGRLPRRLVVCHLGSGCSVTAVLDGRSVDTSMGYTPLDGLVMATRAGQLDPGVLVAVQRRFSPSPDELERTLDSEAGLKALAGTADLRDVLARAAAGDAVATSAYQAYLRSIIRYVGACVAVLGGLDALVFTGGVGENAARVRADVCAPLAFLGLRLGESAPGSEPDVNLAAPGSSPVLRVHAREDLTVLREVLAVLAAPAV